MSYPSFHMLSQACLVNVSLESTAVALAAKVVAPRCQSPFVQKTFVEPLAGTDTGHPTQGQDITVFDAEVVCSASVTSKLCSVPEGSRLHREPESSVSVDSSCAR